MSSTTPPLSSDERWLAPPGASSLLLGLTGHSRTSDTGLGHSPLVSGATPPPNYGSRPPRPAPTSRRSNGAANGLASEALHQTSTPPTGRRPATCILRELREQITKPCTRMRALGFCVRAWSTPAGWPANVRPMRPCAAASLKMPRSSRDERVRSRHRSLSLVTLQGPLRGGICSTKGPRHPRDRAPVLFLAAHRDARSLFPCAAARAAALRPFCTGKKLPHGCSDFIRPGPSPASATTSATAPWLGRAARRPSLRQQIESRLPLPPRRCSLQLDRLHWSGVLSNCATFASQPAGPGCWPPECRRPRGLLAARALWRASAGAGGVIIGWRGCGRWPAAESWEWGAGAASGGAHADEEQLGRVSPAGLLHSRNEPQAPALGLGGSAASGRWPRDPGELRSCCRAPSGGCCWPARGQ